MENCISQLETFEDIINGDLRPELIQNQKRANNIKFIQEHHDDCKEIVAIQIDSSKSTNQIDKITRVSIGHPRYHEFQATQLDIFNHLDLPNEVIKILTELKIKKSNIISLSLIKNGKYETIKLELNSNWNNIEKSRITFTYFNALLKSECRIFKRKIKSEIFNTSLPEDKIRIIQNYQEAILSFCYDLIDLHSVDINRLKVHVKSEYSNKDIFTLMYHYLESLLVYIERHFIDKINPDKPVPMKSSLITKWDLSVKADQLLKNLVSFHLNSNIFEEVIIPVLKIKSETLHNRITYAELNYMQHFINRMNFFFESNEPSKRNTENFIEALIDLNFNSIEVLDEITSRITKSIEILEKEDALEELKLLQKTLKQSNPKLKIKYNPELSSLRFLIIRWVSEEIKFRQSNTQKVPVKNDKSTQKLDTSLSVGQLALLVKLMAESGIIKSHSPSEIHQVINANFNTIKSNSISENSFKNKFYNHDTNAVLTIRKKLKSMLELLDDK